jgi:hypothetical protein
VSNGPLRVDVEHHRISELIIAHYDRLAEAYWDGTREHDVYWKSQQRRQQIDGYRGALAVPRRFWLLTRKCLNGGSLRCSKSSGIGGAADEK